ncbi:MAG: outer membrane protein assembly factor BamC [Pseudomonadota bacterium]
MQFKTKLIIILISQAMLLGCDSMPDINDTFSGRKVDYKKQSRSIERLEVPPQLITTEATEAMVIPDIVEQSAENGTSAKFQTRVSQIPLSQQVLPVQENIELLKEGNVRYLHIKGSKEQAWNKMREFWLSKGMLIKRETPTTGILETEWAENRADIPQDAIRSALSKVFDGLYSAGTRDKYRVRIEQSMKAGYSELYLTHYGMEEVLEGHEGDRTIWINRPRDPELEAEMLGSMMVFFGLEEHKAKMLLAKKAKQRKDKAVIVRNVKGESLLFIKETFPRAWRRTGAALDRISFIVEDRDRSNGIYYVQYADPLADETKSGWFGSLKFWGKETKDKTKYQIKLTGKDEETIVKVLDGNGQENISGTAYRILTLLHEQLK